jgi:hypothetical protein
VVDGVLVDAVARAGGDEDGERREGGAKEGDRDAAQSFRA